MILLPLIPFIFGILGLIVGSFLNVVVIRFGKQHLGGRSACPQCKKTLTWYELIPVVSYLVQRGLCRKCKASISAQYPIVEIITGVLFYFASIMMIYAWNPEAIVLSILLGISLFIIISFIVLIGVYDTHYQLIPNRWFLGLVITSIIYLVFWYIQQGYDASFVPEILLFHSVGLLIALPFLAIWFFSKGRWMGFGDILLIGWMGLFFGLWLGVSSVFLGIYVGGLFALGMILVKRIQGISYATLRTTRIAFGPFILIGWILTEIFFIDIFSWFIF